MGVATSVGVASGQLLAGFLGPRWGWRIPFVVVAYPAIFFACLLWFTVSDPRKSRHEGQEGIELMSPKNTSASSSTEKYNASEDPAGTPAVSEAYERNPSHSIEKSHGDSLVDPSAQPPVDGHAAITDCKRFGLVWRGRGMVFCQKINGEVLELEVSIESSIYDVKEKLAGLAKPDEAQAYPLCQRLMKDGTALENTQERGLGPEMEKPLINSMEMSRLVSAGDPEDLQLTLLITMDGLVEALRNPDVESQVTAVEILRNIGTCEDHVLVALGAFLKTARVAPKVLADVATILVEMSQSLSESSEALEGVLLGSLSHRSWRIREAGIQGLINIPSVRKVKRLIQLLKSKNQKSMLDDGEDHDRVFSADMAAVEALGGVAPDSPEATMEVLTLLLQRQAEFRTMDQQLRCLEILLRHFCFESNSKEAKMARGLVLPFYCHLSHELLFQSVHESCLCQGSWGVAVGSLGFHPAGPENWTPRRRPDWKAIMVPLAKRMLRGASLSPEVMRDLLKEMVNTSYNRENGYVGYGFRTWQLALVRIYYVNEHLSPTAVILALRELIAASSNDVSEVMPLLSHPYDALRAAAAYIIVRRNQEGMEDEILEAMADAFDARRFEDSDNVAPGDNVVTALQHFAGLNGNDAEFWLRRSAFKALCAAKMAPREMMAAWIAGNAMEAVAIFLMILLWVDGEAEVALAAIDAETGQEFLCQALEHWDAEIRRLALVKLAAFHQLPKCVHCLAIDTDRKRNRKTNCLQLVPPSARLNGGDATVECLGKLLENPEEKRQVLTSCMGILAGLARAEHPRALEVLHQLTEAKRRYPQSMAVAILDDLKEPYHKPLPPKQWRSSGLKALEDRVHRWADPGYYDREEGVEWIFKVPVNPEPKLCSHDGIMIRGRSNRLFLCQAVPGCIAWSTVTTFVPDYLHKEQGLSVESATLLVSFFGASCLLWALLGAALGQRIYHRNKGHLAYLMASCTSFAVCPFLLLINSTPDALIAQMADDAQGALPSLWALSLAFLGGAAAVTNPNLKGLLMNVNSSATRGTVFALVTLTDDVGKGLGPEVVAMVVSAMGRRWALSAAISCWFLCAVLLYFSRWTLVTLGPGEEIPWRLSVLFNGMRVRDRSFERLFETPLDLPCVMVFGRQDEFYHYGKTSQIALYKDPVVLEHEEGHKFPSAAPRAKEIYDEVVARIYESCGIAPKVSTV
eukprot:s1144_g10.t1